MQARATPSRGATSSPRRPRHRRLPVLVALLALAACSSAPAQPGGGGTETVPAGPQLDWSEVSLPNAAEPLTLAGTGTRLLVGARAASGPVRPRLFSVAPDASVAQIPLTPRSPYAFQASWLSVAVEGDRIIAVGGARGGAHSNTRWTAWSGTAAGVTERPQPFSTFGGYGAGHLVGAVVTSRGPALLGSWEGEQSGLDAAVWLPVGERWVRQSSAGTALESTPELLVGPRSAAAAGPRIVLPGSAVHLTGGQVTQRAAVWQSTELNAGWRRLDLPDAGRRSEAVSAGCTDGSCLLSGHVDGRYALWSVQQTAATRLADVPELAVDEKAALLAPLGVGDHVVVIVPAAARSVVLVGGDRPWTVTPGPGGVVSSSAVVGDWLYALTAPAGGPSRLWRCPVGPLR